MIKLPNILLPSFNGVHTATFELLGWCLRPPTTIQNSKFKRPGCRFESISGHGGCYCGHVRTPVGLLLPLGTGPHPLGNFVAAPAAPAPRHHPFTFKIQMPRSVSRIGTSSSTRDASERQLHKYDFNCPMVNLHIRIPTNSPYVLTHMPGVTLSHIPAVLCSLNSR